LTAEAQIKATSMNLAQTTNETIDELKLLKSVAQLIKGDLEPQLSNVKSLG